MKGMGGLWALATFIVVALFGSLIYMKTSYGTTEPCAAMTRVVAEEMPAALDELGRRYPLQVGLARGLSSLLVDDADDKVRELTRWAMTENLRASEEPPSSLKCFASLVLADLDRASLRAGLVDGLEKSFGLAPSTVTAAPREAPGPSFVTCLVNRTASDVHFSYRWGEDGDWESVTLKKNHNRWFANSSDVALNVRFDNQATEGYQEAAYTLQRNRASSRDCENGRQYDFKWDSGTLKLYGG